MSSYRLRETLGFQGFNELKFAALSADSPIATFARNILEKKLTPALDRKNSGNELQATFRGGKGSPLHEWFPLPEGYSPEFVRSILETYAAKAQTVFDPFCGSGTTALTAATLGRLGLYCEVNPALALVIQAKARALELDEGARHRIASKLLRLADRIDDLLALSPLDSGLRDSARSVFGKRAFFEPEIFNQVLRLRNLLDHEISRNADVGLFLTVAALRSLVPVSKLVRRGDLRFRTESELSAHSPNLQTTLVDSLHMIATDILDLTPAVGNVTWMGSDARAARSIERGKVGAIVTSPPYLNGTNYFRNTKIELWFLRHLSSRGDIRTFRDQAITAGINDVTVSKANGIFAADAPKSLLDTLSALREDAYDQRIPLMVATYFAEMAVVASTWRRLSNQSTRIAVDLGDSCYGDVWVRTDQIFAEIMERNGFQRLDEVVLRERQSRDGRKLQQSLQIFGRSETSRVSTHRQAALDSAEARWIRFREKLPHQRGSMAQRNWGHTWHSLCSYQGKLKPAIACSLVDALLPSFGRRILDPFSGVGTIPFEGRLHGHVAYAFDISPAAEPISRAKLQSVDHCEIHAHLSRLENWLERKLKKGVDLSSLRGIRFNGELAGYFHPKTLEEVVSARDYYLKHPPRTGSEALVFSSLLHILHGNRPYALSRRSHPITPFSPSGPFEYRSLLKHLRRVLERRLAHGVSPDLPEGRSFRQDATDEWPGEVCQLDAIVTSPPFFDSTRFYLANWMRLWFAGWNAVDFSEQPSRFVDERQKHSFSVYDPVFAQARERLKRGGYLAIHLGKSRKCDMGEALAKVGDRHLRLIDSFAESVEHCESHGLRDKGTVTHHQYLLFQKS